MALKMRKTAALTIAGLLVPTLSLTLHAGFTDWECVDTDSDGLCEDAVQGNDNCVGVYNPWPLSTDSDMDGYGDACDFDTNNDCVVSVADITALIPTLGQVEPPDSPYDVNVDGATTVSDITMIIPQLSVPIPAGLGKNCASCGNGEPTGIGAMGPCP